MLLSLRYNPQTQRYIYKRVMVHVQAVISILQQIKYTGETFSGSKTTIYHGHIIIVRFNCLYQERKITPDTIGKILR